MGATTIVYATPLRRISRHLVSRSGTLTPTGTYATSGDTFAPVVGKSVVSMNIESKGGFIPVFDAANNKVLWYRDGATAGATALDQVSNGADLTTSPGTVRWSAVGKK